MKRSTIKIIFLEVLLLISIFLSVFVFDIFKIKEYLFITFFLIIGGISYFSIGWSRNNYPEKKLVTVATLVFSFLFEVTIFVFLGKLLGFDKSVYHFNFKFLYMVLLPNVLIGIIIELLRNNFLDKGRYSKLSIIVTFLVFTLIECIINRYGYSFSGKKEIFEVVMFLFMPLFMKNILLSILSYNYGFMPSICYRMVNDSLVLSLPLYPTLDGYMKSMLFLIFPFLLSLFFVWFNNYSKKKNKKEKYQELSTKYGWLKTFTNLFISVVVIVFFLLMTGWLNHFLLVIGSGSMIPTYDVGDLAYVVKQKENIKIGDVLVFNADNKTVIHRVISINDDENDFYYKTRGDNNNTDDNWFIRKEQIIGVAKLRVRYLGIPTVWLNNLFGGK